MLRWLSLPAQDSSRWVVLCGAVLYDSCKPEITRVMFGGHAQHRTGQGSGAICRMQWSRVIK